MILSQHRPATQPWSRRFHRTLLVTVSASALALAAGQALAGNIALPGGDSIPDFGASPTVRSAQSGAWSSPATWNTGKVPGPGDIVDIMAGNTVTFDLADSGELNSVEVQSGGTLSFRTDMTTKMTLDNALEVLQGATLTVGTAASPVQAGKVAEIVFSGTAMDTALDPKLWGKGLIGLGKVAISGAPMSDTFVRLATEPKAGDTTLTLSKPVTGWNVGDKLVLPDSRHLRDVDTGNNYVSELEMVSISAISSDGKTITLAAPLKYAHPAAHGANGNVAMRPDGQSLYPHVMNVTRNVKIHSASATQPYRGHAVFLNRADVDIRYAQFGGMGRTRATDLQNSVTSDGYFVYNDDRNPVQFRNLIGPATPPADGYQYSFIGNSVFCPLDPMPFAWGVNLNHSFYGLVQGNTLYNWAGAGLVTKTNDTAYNTIDGNFVLDTTGGGTRGDPSGTSGSGFWLNGVFNNVRNNVSADNGPNAWDHYAYGYYDTATYDGAITVPAAPGNDPGVSGQSKQVDVNATPLPDFSNNEVYGSKDGAAFWWLGAFFETIKGTGGTVKNLTIWHQNELGLFMYETHGFTFDGLTIIGDPNDTSPYSMMTAGYFADYSTTNLRITNSRFENLPSGLTMPHHCGRGVSAQDAVFMIDNSAFNNIFNGDAITIVGLSSINGSDGLTPCTYTFQNLSMNTPQAYVGWDTSSSGAYGTTNVAATNQIKAFMYDLNGVSTENYALYYSGNKPSNAVNDPKLGWSVKLSGSNPSPIPAPPPPPPSPTPAPAPSPSPVVSAPTGAAITASTTNCQAPCADNFTGSAQGSNLGSVTYSWMFGDNATGSGASVSHTYSAAGSYTATLVASNAAGSASATKGVTVTALPAPAPAPAPAPSPAPSGSNTVNVSTLAQLQSAVANLKSGQTILITPGTYNLTDTLYLPQNISNVAIRGASGNRDDVVINGKGMTGSILFGFWAGNVSGVTFADMTIRNFGDDAIILNAGVQNPVLSNLHLADTGEQLVKSNPDGSGGGVNNGVVKNSLIEYTTAAPTVSTTQTSCYTNGVDVHTGQNWLISHNVFRNIHCADGTLAGPAILMWNHSGGTVTEGNTFINNGRDIAYGLQELASGTDHAGGIIRNNAIYHAPGMGGDTAISVIDSPNTEVLDNTVMLNGNYPNAIEYRFPETTGATIGNNLTDAAITARDGATGTLQTNMTGATTGYFASVDPANAKFLRLAAGSAAIDKGTALTDVTNDIDGDKRPYGPAYDVGADEWIGSGTPTPSPSPVPTPTPAPTPSPSPVPTPTPAPSPSPASTTLWPGSAAPANASEPDASAVELGFQFKSDVAGTITGIRFYKGAGNTGTHVGHLWSSGGTLLAKATFSGETATGWQQVNFATPVAISANTVYVASYHTNSGHYADDQGGFASGVDHAPLHALADGANGPDGVYAYGSGGFPNSGWNASNYWVDVVFKPR